MRAASYRYIVLLSTALFLGACGGGSSSGPGQGTLSIQLTDAPVDGVTNVTVEFAGITVNPNDGPHIDFTFDTPVAVDLAALTEDNTEILLNGEILPAGEYNWIRLNVNADCDTVFDSFVSVDTGGDVELRVPSARGLQLGNGFVITANQNTSFVIDWDLRMGLVDPQGSSCFKLRPSLRIIDMTQHGSIAGTVDPSLISDPACTSDPNTEAGNVVYVYEGSDVVPDDIDDNDPEPVTTANVRFDSNSGNYEYMAAFLSPGPYTAAFTCQGQDDIIPDDENPQLDADDDISFTPGMNVEVVDGQTATVNFN